MEIDVKCTIEMNPNLVRMMLCEMLRLHGYECSVDDIVFDVGRECCGIGPMEHDVVVFRGCRAMNVEIKKGL